MRRIKWERKEVNLYKLWTRPILFALTKRDPEIAHHISLWVIGWVPSWIISITCAIFYVRVPVVTKEETP